MTHRIPNPVRLLALSVFFLCASAGFAATSWEYYQAGMRLYNQHQYAEAERYFKAAVQADSGNWQAYQGLGLCEYAQGDKAGAKQDFNNSLRIHPDNPQLEHFADSLSPAPASTRSSAQAAENSPIIGGGNFGIGLQFGGPGDWGASGKYWLDEKDAFQGAVKIGGGTVLQLQYLWHDYDLIHPSQGAFPFYIGVGGDLGLGGGSVAVAGCVPVGLTYLFQKKSAPLDIFVEAVPTLWFFSGGTSFQIYGNVGARFYF